MHTRELLWPRYALGVFGGLRASIFEESRNADTERRQANNLTTTQG